MSKLQRYWHAVRTKQAELTERFGRDCFISSLADNTPSARAGVIVEASAETAARAIIDGTHELATESQVVEYRADQQRRRLAIQRHEMSRTSDGARQIFIGVPTK